MSGDITFSMAVSAATGIAGVVISGLGITPLGLQWGCIGGLALVAIAPDRMPRLRAMAIFTISALAGALFARIVAKFCPADEVAYEAAAAFVIAFALPMILPSFRDSLAGQMPVLVGGLIERVLSVLGVKTK